MNSNVKHPYDAATAFRAPGSAALTASGNSDEVKLDFIANGRGAYSNKLGSQAYAAVFCVESMDTADGDESYKFDVQVDGDPAFASPVSVGSFTANGPGSFVLNLDGDTMAKLEASPLNARIALTSAGVSSSVAYSAWLAPIAGH